MNESQDQPTLPTPSSTASEGPARSGTGERAPSTLAIGTRIGPFVLSRHLGSGGMGQVYLAEQLEPVRREVALKLINERLAGAKAEARFEIERQALARMRHPAIAQIHEAGTTEDGYPWLAMEYVPGLAIDDYCRSRHLGLHARLELYRRVLLGVRHAHERGILHLDLKPANLLVTEVDGQALPKIIDFGLAVSARRPPGRGGPRMLAGTPGYMSPEQAGEELDDKGAADVDVRSDVHALGAVLHELVTDDTPWPKQAFGSGSHEEVRAVYQRQPPGLASNRLIAAGQGARARAVAGDLDAIIERALAPDRRERYESVGDLMADIERFLEGRPVSARDGGALHRSRLFLRRHRRVFAVGMVTTLALLSGLVVAAYGLLEARQERDLAEQRRAETERVAQFQQAMLRDVDPAILGQQLADYLPADQLAEAPLQHYTEAARRLLGEAVLGRAAAAITRDFAGQPALAAELWRAIANSQRALGRETAALEATDAALAALAEAGALASDLHVLELGLLRARIEAALGRGPAQLPALADIGQQADSAGHPALALDARMLAIEIEGLERGRLDASIDRAGELVADYTALLGPGHERTIVARQSRARLLIRGHRFEEALPELESLHAAIAELRGKDHPQTFKSLEEWAIGKGTAGQAADALPMFEQLLAWRRERLGARHPDTLNAMNGLAVTLNNLRRWPEAIAVTRDALHARQQLLGRDHPQTLRSQLNLGAMLASNDEVPEALAVTRECFEARLRVLGPDNPDVYTAAQNLVDFEIIAGNPAEGLRLARLVVSERQRLLPPEHDEVTRSMPLLARALAAGGAHTEAIPLLQAAMARDSDPDDPSHQRRRGLAAWYLAQSLRAQGRGKEADALLADHLPPLLAQDWTDLNPPERHVRRLYEAWMGGR
jgi:non-specific serine/threonine protein kinase/serine/threonine-protein kinase